MEKIKNIICKDEKQTISLGCKLASIAQSGDCFALFGTLGMGKSVLARAFIQELTKAEEVPSPTFTLLQSYEAPEFEIYHFDLYRIKSAEEVFELGIEDALYQGVSLIEWPDKMGGYLPKDIFKLTITPYSGGRKVEITTTSDEKFARLSALLD